MKTTIIRDLLSTERVQKTCYAIACSIAKYDSNNASDISQQAYLEMLESEDDYQNTIECPEDFYREYTRLAVNAYSRLIYSMRNLQEVSDDLGSVEPESDRIEIESILDKLPRVSKTICTYLYNGYTQSDIAKTLNISQQSVSRFLAIARKDIKKCIA